LAHPGEPIRVLRVISRLNVGGPAIQAVTLTHELASRRYETTLVHGREGPAEGNMQHLADHLGVRPVFVPSLQRAISGRDVLALLALRRLLNATRPHVLHTHAAKAGALGRLATLLVRPSHRPRVTVHTFHGHVFAHYFSARKTNLFRLVERTLARRTTVLVAVSDEVKADLVRLRIAPPEQIAVIPLGFDLRPFAFNGPGAAARRSDSRARFGLALDDRVVTIVARLVRIKRVDRFLAIARRLTDLERVRFMVVGDGELAEELRGSADARAVAERAVWTGLQRDMSAVYAASNIVVSTSDNEGTPVSLIEAQAAGLPVVAADVGGVRTVVGDGETGRLVDPDDLDGFASAVRDILLDPDLARQLGEGGRIAATRFGLDRLVNDLDALYQDLLSTSDASRPRDDV
jgi:glycosyltransferase involved in cell wall biosynthesis